MLDFLQLFLSQWFMLQRVMSWPPFLHNPTPSQSVGLCVTKEWSISDLQQLCLGRALHSSVCQVGMALGLCTDISKIKILGCFRENHVNENSKYSYRLNRSRKLRQQLKYKKLIISTSLVNLGLRKPREMWKNSLTFLTQTVPFFLFSFLYWI